METPMGRRWSVPYRRHARAWSLVLLVTLFSWRGAWVGSAGAAGNPDFDAVSWIDLGCTIGDPPDDTNPRPVDLVGNATYPPAYIGLDSTYLYFCWRVNADPSGVKGFDQLAWVSLLQVPSGNPFQYQYNLALNGVGGDDDFGNSGGNKGDTIEISQNTAPESFDFNPIFNDPSEVRLFAQRYDFSSGATVNTTPLARSLATGDGSNFSGNGDFFVEFAFPIPVLIAKGVISSASDLAGSLFLPATSANANNYNKDTLSCPSFLPQTTLDLQKSADHSTLPVNSTTPLTYTLVVTNTGTHVARGVVIDDPALPSYMTNVTVTVTSNDTSVTWSVISTNPLEVRVDTLPIGSSVTIEITADATPACNSDDFTNTATAFATNAPEVDGSATVQVDKSGTEICNGVDDNCNGQIDEGGDALCDDGIACNGSETCGGTAGCQPGQGQCGCQCGDGTVDVTCGEQCDEGFANGTSGSCCTAVCTLKAAGTQCRAASDICDVAETCDGSRGACPADDFRSTSTVCRPLAGGCDVAEACPGNGPSCPADGVQQSGFVCRAVAGPCDTAEACDGSSASCPADGFLSASTVCRPAAVGAISPRTAPVRAHPVRTMPSCSPAPSAVLRRASATPRRPVPEAARPAHRMPRRQTSAVPPSTRVTSRRAATGRATPARRTSRQPTAHRARMAIRARREIRACRGCVRGASWTTTATGSATSATTVPWLPIRTRPTPIKTAWAISATTARRRRTPLSSTSTVTAWATRATTAPSIPTPNRATSTATASATCAICSR